MKTALLASLVASAALAGAGLEHGAIYRNDFTRRVLSLIHI